MPRIFGCLLALLLPAIAAGSTSAQTLPDPLPRRGFFGAQVASVAPERLAAPEGAYADGVVVRRVDPGSAAAAIGLEPGDVVLAVGGEPVGDVGGYVGLFRDLKAGDEIDVTLLHEGQRTTRTARLHPLPKEAAPDFDVLYTAVEVGGALRRVIVTRPRAQGRHPAVLLLGGIGCYSLDNPTGAPSAYLRILHHLTRQGFVTVRVEKSGMGDSGGPPCSEVDLETELAGYVAAAEAAKAYPFVDTARLFLLGHSIGGVGAPVVAGRVPVAGVAVISTSSLTWFEYELANLRRQLDLDGARRHRRSLSERQRALHAPDAHRARRP